MTLFNIQNSFTCKVSLFLSFFWFPWVLPLLRVYVLEFYYGIRAELVESFIWYSLKLFEFTSSIFYLFPYFQCLVLPDQVEKFFFVFFFWFLILALFFVSSLFCSRISFVISGNWIQSLGIVRLDLGFSSNPILW